jgi:hypothetical protein
VSIGNLAGLKYFYTFFLVLVLGLCFFAGGMRFSEQGFDASGLSIRWQPF